MKKTIIGIVCLLFLVFGLPLVFAQPGCCANPGIGIAQICGGTGNPPIIVDISACCPDEDPADSQFYNQPGTPTTKAECEADFFNTDCSVLEGCERGCCCDSIGPHITERSLCTESGSSFDENDQVCTTQSSGCGTPQCNDGADNDCNGCWDHSGQSGAPTNLQECLTADDTYTYSTVPDQGCVSEADATEQFGSCGTGGSDCSQVSFQPTLSAFTATAVRGERRINLNWDDDCEARIQHYEVYRCEGTSCDTASSFSLVGVSDTSDYPDTTGNLKFDQEYTYKIKAIHSPARTTASEIETTGFAGNVECFGRANSNTFCVQPSSYLPMRDYFLNVEGDPYLFASTFLQTIETEKASKINKAWSCGNTNLLTDKHNGNQCVFDTQVCAVRNNVGECLDRDDCSIRETGLFGLFSSIATCEDNGNKYCFFDESSSTIDACYACDPDMSCYDYKSQDACEVRNNCGLEHCEWRDLSDKVGSGVCVSLVSDNCWFCDQTGTAIMDNTQVANNVFETCTSQKATTLQVPGHSCLFVESLGSASSCNDITCNQFTDSTLCSATDVVFNQDDTNTLRSRGMQCGANRCRFFTRSGVQSCQKDSDADGEPDCDGDLTCEIDIYPPQTTIQPYTTATGVLSRLDISIEDKISATDQYGFVTHTGFTTYLCNQGCSQRSHPYAKSVSSDAVQYYRPSQSVDPTLIIFNDQTNEWDTLLSLTAGQQNTILFYSQDPNKNVEEIQSLEFFAPATTTGPVVDITIAGSNEHNGVIYVPHLDTITTVFVDDASIDYADLVDKEDSSNNWAPRPSGTQKTFAIPYASVPNGSYTLRLLATSADDIEMEEELVRDITVDGAKPVITIDVPDIILDASVVPTPLVIRSDKDIYLESVLIDGVEAVGNFTQESLVADFSNIQPQSNFVLEDGNYDVEVKVKTLSLLEHIQTKSFIVNTKPVEIELVSPEFGFSQTPNFDVVVSTDNDAECRYSVGGTSNPGWANMDPFPTTGGEEHKITAFSDIGSGQEDKVHVICDDGVFQREETYVMGVDTAAPTIVTSYANPNPIQDNPSITDIVIDANEPVICSYGTTDASFDTLTPFDDSFNSDDEIDVSSYRTLHRQNITIDTVGTHTFHIKCKDRASRVSSNTALAIEVNFDLPITISPLRDFCSNQVQGNPPLCQSRTIDLSVSTSKKSTCFYSLTDPQVNERTPFLAQPSEPTRDHIKEDVTFVDDDHTIYVKCQDPNSGDFSSVYYLNVTVDTDGPRVLYVDDSTSLEGFSEISCIGDKLRVKTAAEDSTGIQDYLVSLVEEGSSTVVLPFTSARDFDAGFREDEYFWVDGLNLKNDTRYRFKVQVKDRLGQTSAETDDSISNGVLVDAAVCLAGNSCNDNKINMPGELCDGETFSGQVNSCAKYKNLDGDLHCTQECKIDISQCTPSFSCGDGVIDPGEQCEESTSGADVFPIGSSCTGLSSSFTQGSLACDDNCKLITNDCTAVGSCGNGIIDPGETCDPNAPSPFGTMASTSCHLFFGLEGLYENNGKSVSCNPTTCRVDTSECQRLALYDGVDVECGVVSSINEAVLDAGETCDTLSFVDDAGNPLTGDDLTAINQVFDCGFHYGEYFNSGTIDCTSSGHAFGGCQLDTSACVPKNQQCGNGVIDQGETCDPNAASTFGEIDGTCSDFSSTFFRGSLSCTNCQIDTSSCQVGDASLCGNNKIDHGEICDDGSSSSVFATGLSLACSDYSDFFGSGQLACDNCRLSTQNCRVAGIPQVTCRDTGTCADDSYCVDRTDCSSGFCNPVNTNGTGVCASATCDDTKRNGNESDVDCGGGTCADCAVGKSCIVDSDCSSGFCDVNNKCATRQASACEDGVHTAGEVGVDCGGTCTARCDQGQACAVDTDCVSGLECRSNICKLCADNDEDCDGTSDDGVGDTQRNDEEFTDGIPNSWLIENGLDITNPNIGSEDADGDGLSNLAEYNFRSQPLNQDTDKDGATDYEEWEAGTDPNDPNSYPKSGFLSTLLLILGILVLIAGLGYVLYVQYMKRESEEYSEDVAPPLESPTVPDKPSEQTQTTKLSSPPKTPPSVQHLLRLRHAREHENRDKIFSQFEGGKKKPQPTTETKPAVSGPAKPTTPHKTVIRLSSSEERKKKKTKNDVFDQLSEIVGKEEEPPRDPLKELKALTPKKKKKKAKKKTAKKKKSAKKKKTK